MEAKKYSVDVPRKKCVTPICRGSYVNILEPKILPQSDKLAWGMQCLFPKNEITKAWAADLKKIYSQVLLDKFGKEKAAGIAKALAATNSLPLRDGDGAENAGLANIDQLAGHYFINSNNKFRQPHIIGALGKVVDPTILGPDDIYSGAWYRVMLEFWYYDTAGNKGISTTLVGIMKVKDDDNLGAGTSSTEAAAEFNAFANEAADLFNVELEEVAEKEEVKKEEVEKEEVFNFM